MPNTYSNYSSLFTGIADALRSIYGTSSLIKADDFPDMILNAEGGGSSGNVIPISYFNYLKSISNVYDTSLYYIRDGLLINRDFITAQFTECLSIGDYAFSGCSLLKNITLDKCSYIDRYAFHACNSMIAASFPKCEYISEYVFYGCRNLLSLYLLNSVIVSLASRNAFETTPMYGYASTVVFGSIFVTESLYNSYINDQKWIFFKNRFVGV